jgi:hypothetical protein
MNTQAPNDLGDFYRFVAEKVNNGGTALSPEEVLDEWRTLHPDAQAVQEDIAAIQEAIDDMANGDQGVGFEEFDRDFRARRKLPRKP